ncbi:hypothetical protein ACFU6K_33910 [Kitasatospora sp. NPDC057512]|uniref:hypothetical protein n=1 Tax=Kitasatospora sp. NPDC057512 TaxID=3346154 RepID=UPI0036B6E189
MPDPVVDGEGHPKEPTASASDTGAARANDGGTAISGTVVGSNVNSRIYTLYFWGRAASWSLPTVLIGLVAVVTLVRQPQGRIGQFTPVYLLLGAALLASVLLTMLAGEQAGRGDFFRSGLRLPAAFLLCLVAAGAGLLWMGYLRDHGEVDVAGGHFRVENATEVGDGEGATLVVDADGMKRDGMKVTVSIGQRVRNGGSCAAATTLGVALEGKDVQSANRSLEDGDTADLRLDGGSEIRVRLIVHTQKGCQVNLGVTKVLLYG